MKQNPALRKIEIEIEKAIADDFNRSKEHGLHGEIGWANIGLSNDYYIFKELSVKNILKSIKNSEKITYLDIGCGYGTLVENINNKKGEFKDLDVKVTGYGVTAHDRKKSDPFSSKNSNELFQYYSNSDKIIVGDAHNLTTIPQLAKEEFDIITCISTACHFVHPKTALIEAYTKLKIGGFLIIDALDFRGLTDYQYSDLFQYLRNQGYKLITFLEGELSEFGFMVFILQKTAEKPALELPLEPIEIKSGKVIYSLQLPPPDTPLYDIPDKIMQPIRNYFMKLIEEKGEDFCFADKFHINLPHIVNALDPLAPYPIVVVRNKLLNDLCSDKFKLFKEYTFKSPKYAFLDFSSDEYCAKECKEISREDFVIHVIVMMHRDIKFHNSLARFRKQLQAAGLPLPEVEFFEEMNNAVKPMPPLISPELSEQKEIKNLAQPIIPAQTSTSVVDIFKQNKTEPLESERSSVQLIPPEYSFCNSIFSCFWSYRPAPPKINSIEREVLDSKSHCPSNYEKSLKPGS